MEYTLKEMHLVQPSSIPTHVRYIPRMESSEFDEGSSGRNTGASIFLALPVALRLFTLYVTSVILLRTILLRSCERFWPTSSKRIFVKGTEGVYKRRT